MRKHIFSIWLTSVLTAASCSITFADNPLKHGLGMADPHAYVFEDRVYLYATRDADPNAKDFVMPDWNIWSSDNLIDWKLENTIYPTQTYMESNDCWATETVFRNGLYYFYFSNGNKDTGVMISKSPQGPFVDALKKPLLESTLTIGKEYDATVILDDDDKAYILFGHYRATDENLRYYIAQLKPDMISLAESPRTIEITGDINVLRGNDKPNLHKRGDTYYLSAGSHYAVSDNVYGPYVRVGNSGNNEFGLDSRAHGNYFKWNNQWFHTWCHFHLGKDVARYRESYMSYLHYKENGEMVTDTVLLDKHFAIGVGQYNANWDIIEAEWYMAASRDNMKTESSAGGFEVSKVVDGDCLYYPNIAEIRSKKEIVFGVSSENGGVIEVRQGAKDGNVIGKCVLPLTNSAYEEMSCEITPDNSSEDIYLVFRGKTSDICHLDYFKFK